MSKKVMLIHTGGTIGMSRDNDSGTFRTDKLYDSIIGFIPELSKIADIDIEIPYVIDSAELTYDHLRKIVSIIRKNVDQYSGFVISHGTDTLAYTASALSYMLMNLAFPVILTGAQKPLSVIRSDARSNLINAIELSTMGVNEVSILFDDKLMRGNRTIKSHASHFDAFSSPNYPLLAEAGINIEIYKKNILNNRGLFHIFDKLDNSVAVMKIFPGFSSEFFEPSDDIRAVILIGYGAGTVPMGNSGILEKVKKWVDDGKLVVFTSETKAGSLHPNLYESGKKLLDLGAVDSGDMTFEATITKVIFLLGQYVDMAIIKKNFKKSLAGEISSI